MRAAGFLLALASGATHFVNLVRAASPKVLNVTFPDPPSDDLNVIHDNYLGISWELFTMSYLWGESPDTMPNAMKNYLANANERMTHPLKIRVGGNSMDASRYVRDQENMITLTHPDAYFNDVPCDFGPMLFTVLNAMADEIGEMEFSISTSMRWPLEDNIIELTADIKSMLGSRLDSIMLGNEPDLYHGHDKRGNYTIDLYVEELNQLFQNFENSEYGDLSNETVFGGPTVCCRWDLVDILEAGMADLPYKYYTLQRYPQHRCNGTTERSGNFTYFLSHVDVPEFLQWNDEGIALAKSQGVPVLLTEYNSVACGGDPVLSPTFTTTLWSLDVALQAAAGNYSGIMLHTREHGITYNLMEPGTIEDYQQSDWRTGSVYYTVLAIAEMVSDQTSVVVDLDLDNSLTSYNASVAAYAVYDGPELSRSKFVFINFDYPLAESNETDESGAPLDPTQTFVLPADLASQVGVRYLVAPNITEETNITWAGQTVGPNGDLQGEQTIDIYDCSGGCNVTVPGPGIAVVWLDPESDEQRSNIYFGNSTIAGIFTGESSGVSFRALHDPRILAASLLSAVAFVLAF